MSEVLYRYENAQENVVLYSFPITKETPSGVWISHYGKKKFVLKGGRRKALRLPDKRSGAEFFP
jgi:hypothetical protein